MGMIFTELVRWVFAALALYILLRSIVSLLRNKSYAEVWAYLHLETLKPLKDDQFELTEISDRTDRKLRYRGKRPCNVQKPRPAHERRRRKLDFP